MTHNVDSHCAVCQVLKVVRFDSAVRIGGEHRLVVKETGQALDTDPFPRVKDIPVQVLRETATTLSKAFLMSTLSF